MVRKSSLYKKSRRHGANRLLSYTRIKSKREKWYKVRRKRIRFKARSNKKRLSPLSYINKRYLRLRSLSRLALFNRLYWKSLYPKINVTEIRLDKNYNLRDKCSNGESVLWKVETRLDVILWRSGIASSVLQGKEFVKSGRVELYEDGKWSVAKRPDERLLSGIVMKLLNWPSQKLVVLSKWKNRSYKHKVPSYRIVNYKNGLVTTLHQPKDGEVLVPTYIPIRVAGLVKHG